METAGKENTLSKMAEGEDGIAQQCTSTLCCWMAWGGGMMLQPCSSQKTNPKQHSVGHITSHHSQKIHPKHLISILDSS